MVTARQYAEPLALPMRRSAGLNLETAMSLITLLRRQPLIGYFALAYGITWGGILLYRLMISLTLWVLVELLALALRRSARVVVEVQSL
jgi:hypothetical protein